MPSGSKISTARHAPTPLAWRVWPVVDTWRGGALGIILPLAAVGVSGAVTGRIWPAIFVMLAVVASMWRAYLPVYFELNALGITQRCLQRSWRIPWQSIHYFKAGDNGIFVAPIREPHSWSVFRGQMIPTAEQRDAAVELFAYYLERKQEREDFSFQSESRLT